MRAPFASKIDLLALEFFTEHALNLVMRHQGARAPLKRLALPTS